MANTNSTSFFFDTSVIIAIVIGQQAHAHKIEKFVKDVNESPINPRYVSQSVVKECDYKFNNTVTQLGTQLFDLLINFLHDKSISTADPISKINISELELFFMRFYYPSNAISESIGQVEYLLICKLQEAQRNNPTIDFTTFQQNIRGEILDIASDVSLRYNDLIKVNESLAKKMMTLFPDFAITQELLKTNGISRKDADHISSVYSYQRSGKKALFITLDRNTILKFKTDIFRISGVVCCDPIYAIHNR